jgi:prohibitin 1
MSRALMFKRFVAIDLKSCKVSFPPRRCRCSLLCSLMKLSFRLGALIVLLVLLLLLLVRVPRIVPAGHVGLVDFFGHVSDNTLNPGLHFVNPLAVVHRLSVRTGENKQIMDTPSSEGLIVHLEVSLISHLNPARAVELYKTIGLDYEAILVVPNLRSAVREVTSSFEAKALYSTEREKMSRLITEQIIAAVEPRGIVVERVLMRDVALPARLQASIEEKLSAEQDAERMQFILVKERQEAERRRIEAEGIAKFQPSSPKASTRTS